MSKKLLEESVRTSLEGYFRDLRGTEPGGMHDMLVRAVEKPLLGSGDGAGRPQPVQGRAVAGFEPQHAAQEAAGTSPD
jgi:hypothetical protein